MNKSKLKWYEEEFEEINNLIKNKNSLSHYEFLRIRNFKLQTLTRECENQIQGITRKAFKLAEEDKIEEAIEKLIQMHGVGIPIASTILAMKFPEKYAIIDKRVIKNLRKEEAVIARRIIEGLRIFENKQIDTSNYTRKELVAKLEELSTTKIVT